jgi:inner membrane protein
MTPDGYVEGERSLVADDGPMRFRAHASDVPALAAARGFPSVARLLWFDHGFAKAQVRDGELVVSDLRMGSEPDYAFRFAVAREAGGRWQAIVPPRQPPLEVRAGRDLAYVWRRIWADPPPP